MSRESVSAAVDKIDYLGTIQVFRYWCHLISDLINPAAFFALGHARHDEFIYEQMHCTGPTTSEMATDLGLMAIVRV